MMEPFPAFLDQILVLQESLLILPVSDVPSTGEKRKGKEKRGGEDGGSRGG